MIQNFIINIKNIFNKNIINFQNPLSLAELQSLESYCLNNLKTSSFHSHRGTVCKSPNMKYFKSYNRNYIIFCNNSIVEGQCSIPVLYCSSCKHYHAVLTHFFIVPYCQYSIPFILCVLFDKYCRNLTVEEIVNKYNISTSTLYRWIKKFSFYLSYYRQLRNKYSMNLFISLLYCFTEVMNDLFDISAHAVFQYNRSLYSSPPVSDISSLSIK